MTRQVPVMAMKFDGDVEAARHVLWNELGYRPDMPEGLNEDSWLMVDHGHVTAMPDAVFQRCYVAAFAETADQAPATTPVNGRPRTCFDCEHYATANGGQSKCLLYDEQILSERDAAADCDGYVELQP